MAVLNAAKRKKMPAKEFAGPGKSFPINDKTHARMAISGATRSENAGNISVGEANKIKAEARAKLGKSTPKKASQKPPLRGGAADPNGTHNDGGLLYHNNMKGAHDMPVEHTTKTR